MKNNFLSLPSKALLAVNRATLLTGFLSASLLLSGCSNSTSNETATENDVASEIAVDNINASVAAATTDNNDKSVADVAQMADDNVAGETSMPSSPINPAIITSDQPSIVTNPTEPNTPEDTVKQALNTLYYGDVEDAVGYYQVDMDNFKQELANTQSAFQQTVESVTITNTQYSVDKIRVTVTGELRLKGQSAPAPLSYDLRKVNGQWKILG